MEIINQRMAKQLLDKAYNQMDLLVTQSLLPLPLLD